MPAQVKTRCCIVGGGPAGMMLGFLLARSGVEVLVLEKHGDFLRDFRGDTVHPSTLEVMHELGLLDEFLKRPHQKAYKLTGYIGGTPVVVADFTHLPTHAGFIALMPQWEFLDFLAKQAKAFPKFTLRMRTEATELVEENGQVVGVNAKSPEGPWEIRADLVVACDGRSSILRHQAKLPVLDLGAPIDVLWLKLSKKANDPEQPAGRFGAGTIFVMIDRGEYWQCAYVIPKGGIEAVQSAGLAAFKDAIAKIAPFVVNRLDELESWDHIKLLTVAVNRLQTWHKPGLLCIGDAAHAMSPVAGVGINLAIQDAVASANILAEPLSQGAVTEEMLAQIQKRREWPTKMTQWLQLQIQNRILSRVLASQEQPRLPWVLRLVRRLPILARIPARFIGLGFRPEHVTTKPASS